MRKLLTVAALAALTACAQTSTDTSAPTTVAQVGKPAPQFSEPAVSGGKLNLADFKGKAIYLNFFATWCPPCNEEAPAVERLQNQYAARGLQVIGVDVLENQAKAQSFVKAHDLTYPAVVDDGTLRDQYRINGLPVHVFIDRSGTIKKIELGELTPAEMEADVKTVL